MNAQFKVLNSRKGRSMANTLKGKTVAILATDGFEQSELMKPKQALEEAGAKTKVISPADKKIKGWNHKEWGEEVAVDVPLKSADPTKFDALLLPGGVMNPDQLRMDPEAVKFVKSFFDQRKPVAAICHGPWMLVEAGAVHGRTVTSWPSLKTDIRNAGGTWVDEEVTVGNGVVTSRKPDDIPAFNREMIALFAKGAGAAAESERKAA
jgi:protease I